MPNMDDCLLCGAVIPDMAWNQYADLCPECDVRAMQNKTHDERKGFQWFDWQWFMDDVESTYVPGTPQSEWASAYEWGWSDWLADSGTVSIAETSGTRTPGYIAQYQRIDGKYVEVSRHYTA